MSDEPAHRCPVCNLPAYLSFRMGRPGHYVWYCTFHLPDRRLEAR